jgi:hypothetical protein
MRVTIGIPDEVLARELRVPLRRYVTEALEDTLRRLELEEETPKTK